jgi:hypothetical protein
MSIKEKGKINIFQKHFSEKNKGGGQLSGAEKFLRASVTVLEHSKLHRTENQSVTSWSRHWQRQWRWWLCACVACACTRLITTGGCGRGCGGAAAAALTHICRERTMRLLVYSRHACTFDIFPPPAPQPWPQRWRRWEHR